MHRLDGEYDESLKAFEKLSRLDPAARAVSAYNRARIFIYKREYDKAMRGDRKGRESRAEPSDAEDLSLRRCTIIGAITTMAIEPDRQGARRASRRWTASGRSTRYISPVPGRADEARAQLTDRTHWPSHAPTTIWPIGSRRPMPFSAKKTLPSNGSTERSNSGTRTSLTSNTTSSLDPASRRSAVSPNLMAEDRNGE